MTEDGARWARIQRLLEAARLLSNPEKNEGKALRRRLLETTGLSQPNIELGLSRCLETEATGEQVEQLLQSTPASPRAHVLLSANVFVAALRAIALGVASSKQVTVRASRRDPALAEALHALVPNLFELKTELSPRADDHVWAYAADETLASVRSSLPSGVWFHAHGAGMGAVVVEGSANVAAAQAIALDTALFDQRGCLSPRVVGVIADEETARGWATAIASALEELEKELPLGPETPDAAAERRRARDTTTYAYESFGAGSGWITFSSSLTVQPALRSLHVAPIADPVQALEPVWQHLTCIATNSNRGNKALQAAFPGARITTLGDMQRPSFDGPVDRRHGTRGERLP